MQKKSGRVETLLRSKQEIDARRNEKRARLLEFLRTETFTSIEVAGELLGIQRNAVYKTLRSLRAEGLIEKHQVQTEMWAKILWGITTHGAAVATPPGEDFFWFEPGRTSASTLAHDLWLQKIRVKADGASWKNWQPERAIRRTLAKENKAEAGQSKWLKVPDAVAENPDGEIIAIEVERTIKSPKRYQQIMLAYLQMITSGLVSRVEYVCITPVVFERLPGIFRRIEYVTIEGERLKIEDKHRSKFSFLNVQEWPTS